MKPIDLSGMGVALVTPFNHNKAIDFDALGRLIDYQIEAGADYLVVLGTTSEAPTLESEERRAVREYAATRAAGRVPLVLGLGGNCTSAVVRELETLPTHAYSAILSVVPYYNKPSQEGIYHHYVAIHQASPLPVILYNVPSRTGVNMTADTTLRIARDCSRVIAVKEASGNLDQARRIIAEKPDGFTLLSGDDSATLPLIECGASGVISVIGNALPGPFAQMVHAALSGDIESARAIDNTLRPYYPLLSVEGNPAGIKCLLAEMGRIANELRLPLVPVSSATQQAIHTVFGQNNKNH